MDKNQSMFSKLMIIVLAICILLTLNLEYVWAITDEQTLEDKIDRYIEQHEDTGVALAAIVVKDGEVIVERITGFADKEKGIEATKDTVFEWGSCSKILVWISVMQLMEDGLIDLNTDINEYLPEDYIYPKSYDEPVTMVHLMNHSAGFDDTYTDLMVYEPDKIDTLRQALDKSDVKQEFTPGELVAYSNYGSALAAYIVEVVSGMDYGTYVKENIFEPLGMEYTSIGPDMSDNPWVKEQRDKIQGYTLDKELIDPNIYVIPIYPAGSAVGIAEDFAKLLTELLSKDGSNIFKNKETIKLMFEPTAYYPNTSISRIAHGLWTFPYQTDIYGHGGNTMAFSSVMYMDRGNKTGVIVMTNQYGEIDFTSGIPNLVFNRLEGSNNDGDLEDSSKWEGLYQPARLPYHGFTKLFALANRISVKQEGEHNLITNKHVYIQNSPGIYTSKDEIGTLRLDVYSSHETFGKILSSAYGDLISIPLRQHVFQWGLAITGIIGMVSSLFYCLLKLIKRIRTSKSKASKSSFIILIINLLNLLMSVNLILMTKEALSMTTYDSLKGNFVINIFYMIVTVPILGYGIIKRKEFQLNKKQKLMFLITIIFTTILWVNLWYWEFYR